MLHSRAIGIIENMSFLVGNWPYKVSLRPFMLILKFRFSKISFQLTLTGDILSFRYRTAQ